MNAGIHRFRRCSLIGRSDKAGSGVDKIIEGWKFAKWRRPYICEKSHPDTVELFLPLESLFSEDTISELKHIFGESIISIPHNELIILATALTEGTVSNSSLQNAIELHPSDLTKLLKKMCKDGVLVNYGFGRGTIYQLNRNYDVASSDVASSDVASSDVASSDVASSDVTSSDVASSDVASSDVASIHDEDNVISMIRDQCSHKWMSAKEISSKIGRHPTHTRRIIKKMLTRGILTLEYPERPTHPAQRYRSL